MVYDEHDGLIARMYDADYGRIRTPSGDVEFYRARARAAGGPVLEIGCGTGRILVPLARDGVDVTGLDSSTAMLERCRAHLEREGLQAPLHRADMRAFDLGRRFRLVTIPFRALGHVENVEGQVATLAGVARHLEPGGRLVFDLFQPNPKYLAQAWGPRCDCEREEDGVTVRRYASARPHLATQTTEVTFRWEWEHPDGTTRSETAEFVMRWYHRFEVEHLLARAGFDLESVHGDFAGGALDDDSPEMVFTARRSD